jgi:phosphoribosylamine---glycine ligase
MVRIMNLLLIDGEHMGLDLAYRAAEAGHAVKLYRIENKGARHGEGFPGVELVDGWKEHMNWAKSGLVVTTGNHKLMRDLDRYREYGFPIFAPTHASAQLEINRKTGMDLMQKHGANIAPFKMFDSLQAAISHVVKTDEKYVFKTMGDEEDKSLSYVCQSPEDMVAWLQKRIEEGMKPKGPVMLQECVDMVGEVGIAAWVGPKGFIDHCEISFEHKKLMPGNFGPNTGEMGTVCKYVEKDPLVDLIYEFEDDLVKLGHVGDIAINGGITKKGDYYPFEWTARLGWPDFFIRTALHNGDPIQWMRDLLDGKDTLSIRKEVALCVLMTLPPFPEKNEDADRNVGIPVHGLAGVWDSIHPIHMMIGDGPKISNGKLERQESMQTTGEYVLVATGLGRTVKASHDKAYGAISEIKLANAIVRDDIGEKLEEQLPKLHALGYCKEVEYE